MGVAELIIDGESGLLAKPKNVTDLADKLSLIIHDPALSERLSRGGRERVVNYFSCERSALALMDGISLHDI